MFLSQSLPLRSTSLWTGYHETRAIPIVIGRAIMSPVPYDKERKFWVISDQPILGVSSVKFGADPVRAWNWRNMTDSTGHVSAQIEFSEPVPDGIDPILDVYGMPNPITGELLENPADLVWWILSSLAGRAIDYQAFDDARVLFAIAGLFIGGVLDNDINTIRATITEILDSVGATWSLGIPKIIQLYPQLTGTPSAIVSDISDFQATSSFQHLANHLVLEYRKDWAADDTLLAVTVEDLDSQAEYGIISRTVDAPWLRDTAAATALAQRLLQYRAKPVWKYTWRTTTPITPGTWITLNHQYAPVATTLVTGCDYDLAKNEAEIQAEARAT